jgi:hypothetical protein
MGKRSVNLLRNMGIPYKFSEAQTFESTTAFTGAMSPGAGGLMRSTPVVLADAASTTLTIADNAGRTNVVIDVAQASTYNIPTPTAAGQYYHFIYGGNAADGHNHLFRTVTTDNSVYFKGGIQWINNTNTVDNGEVVYSNGSSNELLTFVDPEAYDLHFLALSATVWYVWGWVGSDTTPTMGD